MPLIGGCACDVRHSAPDANKDLKFRFSMLDLSCLRHTLSQSRSILLEPIPRLSLSAWSDWRAFRTIFFNGWRQRNRADDATVVDRGSECQAKARLLAWVKLNSSQNSHFCEPSVTVWYTSLNVRLTTRIYRQIEWPQSDRSRESVRLSFFWQCVHCEQACAFGYRFVLPVIVATLHFSVDTDVIRMVISRFSHYWYNSASK